MIKAEDRKYRPYGDRYDTKILIARESDGMIITTCTSFDEAAEFVGAITPLHVLDALINEESLNGHKFFVPFRYACNEYGMHLLKMLWSM